MVLGKLKITLAAVQWSRSRDWNMFQLQQEYPALFCHIMKTDSIWFLKGRLLN